MPDGIHQNGKRDKLIRLPIGDLAAWHLMVACDHCRAERAVMVRDLVSRFGAEQRLVMLVPKLRCKEPQCRRPPDRIRLRSRFPVQPGPALVEVWVKGQSRL